MPRDVAEAARVRCRSLGVVGIRHPPPWPASSNATTSTNSSQPPSWARSDHRRGDPDPAWRPAASPRAV